MDIYELVQKERKICFSQCRLNELNFTIFTAYIYTYIYVYFPYKKLHSI